MRLLTVFICGAWAFFAAAACSPSAPPGISLAAPVLQFPGVSSEPRPSRLFPRPGDGTEQFPGCLYASPLSVSSRGRTFVAIASSDGTVAGLEPETGHTAWKVRLPAPAGQEPFLLATPVRVGTSLVVAFAVRDAATKVRVSHRVAVIDLEARAVDPTFPEVALSAARPTADGTAMVTFNPSTQISRAALAHAVPAGHALGMVYVAVGNIQDLQPWHGWVFELDLDAWHGAGGENSKSCIARIECNWLSRG